MMPSGPHSNPFSPLEYLKDTMRASKNAVDLIKRFEGCKLEAYEDVDGMWAVGYGTNGPGIHEGTRISQGIAEAMLKSDIAQVSDALSRMVGLHSNQNQYDALTSFAYNLGINALKGSTLLKLLLQGKPEQAAEEFLKWNHVHGQVIEGLTRRREAERTLFLASAVRESA